MSTWREATWTNGKQTVKGHWTYYRPSDKFFIELNSTDRVTGLKRKIESYRDEPEWGNWKLVREDRPDLRAGQ